MDIGRLLSIKTRKIVISLRRRIVVASQVRMVGVPVTLKVMAMSVQAQATHLVKTVKISRKRCMT